MNRLTATYCNVQPSPRAGERYCTTHRCDVSHSDYSGQCAVGQNEAKLIKNANEIFGVLESRIITLESHFNARLKEFAANLEKLHEPPTGQD